MPFEITPEIIDLACQARMLRRLLGWLAESDEYLTKSDIIKLCIELGIEINIDEEALNR